LQEPRLSASLRGAGLARESILERILARDYRAILRMGAVAARL